jgi:hypothetical protein
MSAEWNDDEDNAEDDELVSIADAAAGSGVRRPRADVAADLTEHIRQETGREDAHPMAMAVMTALGVPPSDWYRALLTQ